MKSCTVRIAPEGRALKVVLSDFNRLRWTVAALRSNSALVQAFAMIGQVSATLTDSIVLHRPHPPLLEPGAGVILWDGLNSLLELWQERPDLQPRTDLQYFHVGVFRELEQAYPQGSRSLFAEGLGPEPSHRARIPWWFDLLAQARAQARVWQNLRSAPDGHRQLSSGGRVVFCGLVRPTEAVLTGMLRGSDLGRRLPSLLPLTQLDWQASPNAVIDTVSPIYEALRQIDVANPIDAAASYALINVLQRLVILSQLNQLTPSLLVNEFGQGPYLDPYNALGYRHNLFLDFGSTRGPDLIYPRVVDLTLTHKPMFNIRYLSVGESLTSRLRLTTADDFVRECVAHAAKARQQLAELG